MDDKREREREGNHFLLRFTPTLFTTPLGQQEACKTDGYPENAGFGGGGVQSGSVFARRKDETGEKKHTECQKETDGVKCKGKRRVRGNSRSCC